MTGDKGQQTRMPVFRQQIEQAQKNQQGPKKDGKGR